MSLPVYLVTQCDWWLSAVCLYVCPRSVRACDCIGGNRLCVRSPRAPVRVRAVRAIQR